MILDETTLEGPYARRMERVTRHGSGEHHRVVQGINLLTLLWSDGVRLLPVDYRICDKATDGMKKNESFRARIRTAHERGFCPEFVLFDSWYAALENLKAVRSYGWLWLTRLKENVWSTPGAAATSLWRSAGLLLRVRPTGSLAAGSRPL